LKVGDYLSCTVGPLRAGLTGIDGAITSADMSHVRWVQRLERGGTDGDVELLSGKRRRRQRDDGRQFYPVSGLHDGEQPPMSGDTLQLVLATILEPNAGPGH
jgi:hypothetical protein